MLSEAVKKAAPRQAERDISRAVMNQLNKYRNSSHFAEWLSHAHKKPGNRPEGYQTFAYGLGKKIDVPASAAGGTKAQGFLKDHPVKEIELRIRPAPDLPAGREVFVGGSMSATGQAVAYDDFFRPQFFKQSGAGKLVVQIDYDPKTIKTPEDFQKNLELTHHRQFSLGKHVERYVPKPGDDQSGRAKGPDGKPVKAFVPMGDPSKNPGRSKGFHYMMTKHETQGQIAGFVKSSQITKGSTFEDILDQNLNDRIKVKDITPEEAKIIKNHYMDFTRKHFPCARLKDGEKASPNGCVKLVKQTKKSLAGKRPKSGSFKKFLKGLPILGRILAVAGVLLAAEQAYAKDGPAGVGKVIKDNAVDFTPFIGDAKAALELAALLAGTGSDAAELQRVTGGDVQMFENKIRGSVEKAPCRNNTRIRIKIRS